ncbi:MAG TPA: hypothetical protein VGP79_03260 [Bryobacteraceae bacterium]|nr:hypothetical protein [Bryobacteraceae bacterium]
MPKRQLLLDCALLFLLTAVLIAPLFRIEYLNNWESTDGALITNARYVQEHFPHPKWQALWYGGARFDHLQSPATVFGTAILAKFLRVVPAQGYHILIGAFYCVGVAGVYFMVRVWSGRRFTGWLAAGAYAILSPVFAMFPAYFDDSLLGMPLRLNYLLKWGDGPHISALSIIPFALGWLWIALRSRSMAALLACAAASAAVVSASVYGGAALLVLSAIAVWAIALDQTDRSIWKHCALIVALTYGLCAWWLTPTFLLRNLANLRLITPPGNSGSRWFGIVILVVMLVVLWRFAGRWSGRAWPIFLGTAIVLFLISTVGAKLYGFRIVGEPMRFLPELDLLLILPLAEAVRMLASIRRRFAVAAVLLVLCVVPDYLWHPWSVYNSESNVNGRVEHRLPEWIAQNMPGARVFTSGSMRVWSSAWRDVAEITGGSDQGSPHRLRALEQWQVNIGDDLDREIDWLIASGNDAVIAHEDPSQEPKRQMPKPRKFAGRLPVIYDQGGDIVYRVPRRFRGLARVVNEARMESLAPVPWSNENAAQLRAYAAAAEESATEVGYQRVSNIKMRLRVRTERGESILVQETWDAGWTAYEDSAKLPVVKDVLYFMRIQVPPGEHDIRLVYEWPAESRIGQGVTLLSIVGWLGVAVRIRRRSRPKSPSDEPIRS